MISLKKLLITLIHFRIFAEASGPASKALGILHPAFKIRKAGKCNAAPLTGQQTSSYVVILPKKYFFIQRKFLMPSGVVGVAVLDDASSHPYHRTCLDGNMLVAKFWDWPALDF